MKKIFNNLILAVLLLLPLRVFATGNISVSPSSLSIEEGSSKTFTITAYNTIGDVSISSNNSSVASVSTGEWGTGMVDEAQTKTGTITVTGRSVGTATITVTIDDASTFDSEDLSGQTRTITVNVVAKPTPTPMPTTPNNSNNNSNNMQAKSTNNKLKELSVEGQNIQKVDDNNYTLSVSNDTTSINIVAKAEDSKAKVTGDGNHDINIGDNTIELVITSESGAQNKITIKVTRNDAYYLDELEKLLSDNNSKDISIKLKTNETISSELMSKIKESGKKVNFNYYDNEQLKYSWTVYGNKVQNVSAFDPTITMTSNYKSKIQELTDSADGLYLNTKSNSIPTGSLLKIYVDNKFSEGNVYVYYYDSTNNKLIKIGDKTQVEDGYIELTINNGTDYFISDKDVNNSVIDTTQKKNSILPIILVSLLGIGVIVAIIIILIKNKNKNNKSNNYSSSNNYSENNNNINNNLNNNYNNSSIESSSQNQDSFNKY